MTSIAAIFPMTVPVAAATAPAPAATQTLPLQVGVSARGPRWVFIAGGAVIGALLCGVPGALLGALAGVLLTR